MISIIIVQIDKLFKISFNLLLVDKNQARLEPRPLQEKLLTLSDQFPFKIKIFSRIFSFFKKTFYYWIWFICLNLIKFFQNLFCLFDKEVGT